MLVKMEVQETVRFKDEAAADAWASDQRVSMVRNAKSISTPFYEGVIDYAPFAVVVTYIRTTEVGGNIVP